MRLSREEKQLRTMRRAQKIQRFIDPAAAANQVSVYDAGNGPAASLRQAEREHKTVRVLEQLLTEQQRTNELLLALLQAGQQGGQQPQRAQQGEPRQPYTGGR